MRDDTGPESYRREQRAATASWLRVGSATHAFVSYGTEDGDRQDGGVVVGYAYSPRVLAHDPPPSTVQIAGRAFTLGSANVAQAVLTAQAHELVERPVTRCSTSAVRGGTVARVLAGMDDRPAVGAPVGVDEPAQRRAHRDVRRASTPSGRCASIDDAIVRRVARSGGSNDGTVPALRAMFNDAARAARRACSSTATRSPGSGSRSKGRKRRPAARPARSARMIAAADELTPPSFAAYLLRRRPRAAAARRARRAAAGGPRLHARRRDASTIERQWNVEDAQDHAAEARLGAHDRDGAPARERLLTLPRE